MACSTATEILGLLDVAEENIGAALACSDLLEEEGYDTLATLLRQQGANRAGVVQFVREECRRLKVICWRDMTEYKAAGTMLDRLEGFDWNELPEHEGRISTARLHELCEQVLVKVGAFAFVSAGQGLGGRILLTIRCSFPTTALKLDCRELLERLIACVFPDHADRFEVR